MGDGSLQGPIRPRSSAKQSDDGERWVRFEMYDTLQPNGSALADMTFWNVADEEYTRTTMRCTLHCPHGHCFAIGRQSLSGEDPVGEIVLARYCFDSRRWEVLSEPWMVTRIGKATAAIAVGASGTVDIHKGTAGSETSFGYELASCYNRTQAIEEDDWVTVSIINGQKYVALWSCPT